MSLLIFAALSLFIAAVFVWAIETAPIADPFKRIIQAFILIIAAVVIAYRAHVF